MKTKILTLLLLFVSLLAFGQGTDSDIDKGTGILYYSGVPGVTPDTTYGAEIAMNKLTREMWVYNRDSTAWKKLDAYSQSYSDPSGDPSPGPYIHINRTDGGLFQWTGAAWVEILAGSGDVTGPGTSTDNSIATFDGTGNTIQSSSATVDDSGNIATSGTVDGRDVSVDGAKLDGIEAGATGPRNSYSFTGSEPDTSLFWIDQTTYDSTGVFEVKDYLQGSWETFAWYDSVGNVFSSQPPIYAIITGQSNATPRNSGGDNTPSPYTSWWNAAEGKWTNITLPAGWTTATGNNWWGMHFGRAAAELDNRIVKLIYVARGSRPISGWLDGGLEWTEITNRLDSSHVQRIDAVMWYQGESDFSRTITAYGDDWNTVYSQFQALPEWTNESQILVAQLNTTDGTDTQNGFFNTLAVDTSELTKVVHNTNTPLVDAQHISVEGHRQLGRRMYMTFSGRQEFMALPQRYSISSDTTWDFSNTHLIAENNDTIIAAKNFYNGWNGNVRINDTDSSGVTFNFPVVSYAHDGKEIITGIYGRFSSSAYVENDTLYFSRLPPYYVSNNTVFDPSTLDSMLIAWWSADTLVYTTGAKVDSIGNRSQYNARALIAGGNAPDTTGTTNSLNSISFTPPAWLEIDTSGIWGGTTGLDSINNGPVGGARDMYVVLKTTDAKGALFQGNTGATYAIWDTSATTAGYTMGSGASTVVDGVVLSANSRKELGLAVLENDLTIVQIRQAKSNLINAYLRVFDYGNNLSGFGTTGQFAELIITGAQYSQTEEQKIVNYLRQKWDVANESVIVFSDVGKEKFNNPYGTGESLDATIASIKADLDSQTDDQTASEVNITDAGAYYTGTEVETALQEVGASLATAGDVTGPGTSTDNSIATFDGTGNTIQSSSATVDDNGELTAAGATIDAETASTTGSASLISLYRSSTGDMTSTFGINVPFYIGDNTVTDQQIAYINVTRDGADDSGQFSIATYGSGFPQTALRLDSDQNAEFLAYDHNLKSGAAVSSDFAVPMLNSSGTMYRFEVSNIIARMAGGSASITAGTDESIGGDVAPSTATEISGTTDWAISNDSLVYTGTETRFFSIIATVDGDGSLAGDYSFSIAKNGTVQTASTITGTVLNANDKIDVMLIYGVSMTTNDVLQIFVDVDSGSPTFTNENTIIKIEPFDN